MPALLRVADLTVGYRSVTALRDLTWEGAAGERWWLIGPNGAGKSTLLKALAGLHPVASGVVRRSGTLALVPQRADPNWRFPAVASDVVAMGRSRRWWAPGSRDDREHARAALARVDALDLADVPIGELSGGQQQRVLLARALAAHASIYLLDEPTTGLDSVTQSLVDTVTAELAEAGCLVITATHDLAWVAASTGSFLALRGRECARGPAGRVLAPEVLAAVYGMPAA